MSLSRKDYAKLISKAIFYSSIQASIGSVEMSSKFSVKNFSKDQDTLDNAVDALKNYIWIASVWTVGTMLTLYASYGLIGIIVGLIANAVMMGWIIISYMIAFKDAAEKYNLKVPPIFSKKNWLIMIIVAIIITIAGCYFIPIN